MLLKPKREIMINNFINRIKKDKQINAQNFWQFREFYSPGNFSFDKTQNPFLIYRSPFITSEEKLVDANDLSPFVNKSKIPVKNIALKTADTLVFYENQKTVVVYFIKTNNEMKTSIGFFDYNDKDKKLIENKFWLDKTVIKL